MIIVSNKNIENSIYFPQNIYTDNSGVYKLTLVDRGTNKKYVFDNLDDKHLVQYDFYTFFVDFSDLPEDEYEYSIEDSNNEIVGIGLIRLNSLELNNKYYNKNTEYVMYEHK